MLERGFDVLAMGGRSSIDLYAHQIGVPLVGVSSFDAYVGGCPTNTRHGCANFMPTWPEVEAFVASHGGWQCEPAA